MMGSLVLVPVCYLLGAPAPDIELKPPMIELNMPIALGACDACMLQGDKAFDVLAATPSDPGMRLELLKNPQTDEHVIKASQPAGYRLAEGPHEIVVRTDSPAEPLIRIPVRVWPRRSARRQTSPAGDGAFVGKAAPLLTLERPDGTPIDFIASKNKVTVLAFLAAWCGHCDMHVPTLERVRKYYAESAPSDLDFWSVCPYSGSLQAVVDAVQRWGLNGLITAKMTIEGRRETSLNVRLDTRLLGGAGSNR